MEDQVETFVKILYAATKNEDDQERERVVKKLVEFLKKRRKLYLLPRVLESHKRYLKRKTGVLIFAREMDKKILEKTRETFKDVLQEADITEVKIDKNIIGGFIIKTENFLADASVKGFLQRIKTKFSTNN